jgi:hypothetical protein
VSDWLREQILHTHARACIGTRICKYVYTWICVCINTYVWLVVRGRFYPTPDPDKEYKHANVACSWDAHMFTAHGFSCEHNQYALCLH